MLIPPNLSVILDKYLKTCYTNYMPRAISDIQCDNCGYMIESGDEYKNISNHRAREKWCYSCSTDENELLKRDL